MKQIHQDEKSSRKTSIRRRAIAIAVPAALLSVAATGYAVWTADEVVASGIGCYDSTDTSGNVTILPTESGDPIAACAEVWARGDVTGAPGTPELIACVNQDGGVSVFPTTENATCVSLGLEPLPDGYREEARKFAKMSDEVHRQLYRAAAAGGADPKTACLDETTALTAVRDALRKHAMTGWTTEIHRTGDYQGRSCMNSPSVDYPDQKVWIIPSEPGIIPWHKDPTM